MAKQQKRASVYMNIAYEMASLSSCLKNSVGAVLVRDNMIISTGYNGTPKGVLDCDKGGCARCKDEAVKSGTQLERCICVHAEQNAIVQAAFNGISTRDSVLYCTHKPCAECVKLLINAGVTKVFYHKEYPVEYGNALTENISIVSITKFVRKYESTWVLT